MQVLTYGHMARGSNKGKNPDTINGGFVVSCRKEPTVEVPEPEELSSAAMADAGAVHPRPWTKLPRNRKTKLAVLGIGKDLLDKGDPRYSRAMSQANKYRKARASELAAMHGYVSAGANALLATASLALAASRFLYEKFTEQPDNFPLLKQASSLADSARQAELAAWEMSAREGMVKRKLDASDGGTPWLRKDEPAALPMGRPKKLDKAEKAEVSRVDDIIWKEDK